MKFFNSLLNTLFLVLFIYNELVNGNIENGNLKTFNVLIPVV